MSETQDEQTYTALITLNLPGKGSTEVHITLTPPDTIDVAGRVKPLRDCTLAELQAFADDLEVDVWEVYQSINLAALDEEGVEVEVTVLGKQRQRLMPLQNWHKQMVILPPAETTETTNDIPDEPVEEAEPEPTEALEAVEEPTAVVPPTPESPEPEPEPVHEEAPSDEPESDEPQINLLVAETESVHPEREIELAPREPVIAPSQARVRIAGDRLPNGHPTWMAVDVLIDESSLRAAQAHALSSLDREVAGVLIGPPPEKQPDGRYVVHIIDTIIAKHTVMHGASVTYTPESWRYMNDKLLERYPDESAIIVGWYHTHPGFGIFLSGMDQFIHQNFFTQIWHVALVLDPRARTSGFFCWDRQKTRVSPVDYRWPSWAPKGW